MTTDTSASSFRVERPPLFHKVTPPGLPGETLTRPRLDARVREELERYGVAELIGGPGAGKSVQAQLYAAHASIPLAWFTADRADRSPSSLVFGLAEALKSAAPSGVATVRRAIRAGRTVVEAGALLAGAIVSTDLLLVLDDCHEIDGSAEAMEVLDTFVEYLPPEVRMLLLSRRTLPWPILTRRLNGRLGRVSASDLNLTVAETADFLVNSGGSPTLAAEVHRATGGWLAGASFAARFGLSGGTGSDDLTGYVATQVFAPLSPELQKFLLETSILDVVTLDEALALFGVEARPAWCDLIRMDLPCTTYADGKLTYHSLFRAFLQERLISADPARYVDIQRRFAEHLSRAARHDEAAEIWRELAEWDRFAENAGLAMPEKCARADWSTILRWVAALDRPRVQREPRIVAGWLRAICATRPWEETAELVASLRAEGHLAGALAVDPSLVAIVAWVMQARPEDALQLLDEYQGDHQTHAVRYLIDATVGTEPAVPPPGDTWNDVENAFAWGLILQGRCQDLSGLLMPDTGEPIMNPNLIIAPILRNDAARARELFRRIPLELRDRPDTRFIETVLFAMSQNYDDAERLISGITAECYDTGFPLAHAYTTFAAWILLLKGEIDRAEEILAHGAASAMSVPSQLAYAEWMDCIQGIVHVLRGDVDRARPLLYEVADSMEHSGRLLLLSLVALALSEGEHRAGRPAEASEWAERGYDAAIKTGNYLMLDWAAKLFPDVRRRQIAKGPRGARWRRLIGCPSARASSLTNADRAGLAAPAEIAIRLQPFGRGRDLEINGEGTGVGRIKVLELVACLGRFPGGLDREAVQEMLFPGASQQSGANYYRQITHRLRNLGVPIERHGNNVAFGDNVSVTLADAEFEYMVSSSNQLDARHRIERLESALEMVSGPYLVDSSLPWVEELRAHYALVHEEARLELASLCVERGDLDAARMHCEVVIASNRYADPAYRILLGVERRQGSESSVLAVYRRAVDALGELGLQPGDARRLLELPDLPAKERRAG